ncbi:MAG TPA: helix-turn-helix transcriptional regulator [Candidatus Obscuribacterales bacterium]
MIRWKLRELMARHRLTVRGLAAMTGLHRNSIQHLRNFDELPGCGADTLEKLCVALDCTPFDLIEYIPEQKLSR